MSEDQKNAQNEALEAANKKAHEVNSTRTGKGLRQRVGQTRGRNPQVITWEAFDESLPETLPTSLADFAELTGTKDEKSMVAFLVDGFNSYQYTQASDPIAEYVNPAWPEDVQRQFRLAVRNYAAMVGVSIEDAVALIKPGVEKANQK